MAGHSKWSKIKRDKQIKDQKKGALFSKFASKIFNEVVNGAIASRDILIDSGLSRIIKQAKSSGMSNVAIQSNIDRALNSLKQTDQTMLEAEFYALNGVAVLAIFYHSSKDCSLNHLTHILNKYNLKLASAGSTKFIFQEVYKLSIESKDSTVAVDILNILDVLSEYNIHDIEIPNDYQCILILNRTDINTAISLIPKNNYIITTYSEHIPSVYITCEEKVMDTNLEIFFKIEQISTLHVLAHNMHLIQK